ncbi:origin recognition complex subunit 2 [Pholiota conissans]|uniref:Origin recognition complex subunit 2 n=1 Tax=Pholiota conissans TaxID=109636 RepID=A0A9P5Z6T6_9AGAR|nr:origin recognition complex subunit 2 [Pholiota conissans]
MLRHLPSFEPEPEVLSEEEDDDAELSDESDQSEDVPIHTPGSPQKGKGKAKDMVEQSKIIVQTAFDAYFTYNKPGRVQTSNNVYSQLVLPLSPEEYADAIGPITKAAPLIQPSILSEANLEIVFSRFISELNEGFNILCYGLGSKRRTLNQFATSHCSKRGHVVVVNGFQPEFTLKDMLNSIEDIPDMQDLELPSANTEKQARRIYDFFANPKQKVHLYIIVHNADAAPFRAPKSKSILSLLAHNPRIHVIASIDHINAPLLWSSSEIFSRKPDGVQADATPSRGFAWLWHDLTTLRPYDVELAFADRASLSGAHTGGARRKADALAAQNATAMSETAASHILASVTQKAQKLFITLGTLQLENIKNADDGASTDLQQFGTTYDILFTIARENFYAHSEPAMRSLLGEFRDHNLIVSAPATTGSGELLWIPLRKERLANVLKELQS